MSIIVTGYATEEGYGSDQVAHLKLRGGRIAGYQAAYMATSLLCGIIGGVIAGMLARIPFCSAPDNLFNDAQEWETPKLETPFFHDIRGEISRGRGNSAELQMTEEQKAYVLRLCFCFGGCIVANSRLSLNRSFSSLLCFL